LILGRNLTETLWLPRGFERRTRYSDQVACSSEDQIEDHLDGVEAGEQQDGGWMFDWLIWAPAHTTDWCGNVTIRALRWLRGNGRLTPRSGSREG
jgi:hypothetical protein